MTHSVLQELRFVSVRGFRKIFYSDRGSQLVKGNEELSNMVYSVKLAQIIKFGNNESMIWKFTKVADAPWQNGCLESPTRLVERAIIMSIGEKVLQYGELQTCMFKIANILWKANRHQT